MKRDLNGTIPVKDTKWESGQRSGHGNVWRWISWLDRATIAGRSRVPV